MKRREFFKKLLVVVISIFTFKNVKSQTKSYTLEIDQAECTGCGKCWGEFPNDFQENEKGRAWFKSGCCCDSDGPITHAIHGSNHIEEAMIACPVEAIKEIG